MNTKTHTIEPDSILQTLTEARAPLTPHELAERMHLADEARPALSIELEELERSGRIVRNRAGLLLVAARANLISGQVQGHRDGFGFLIRDDGGQDSGPART